MGNALAVNVDEARLLPHLRDRARGRIVRACGGCGRVSVGKLCPSCAAGMVANPRQTAEFKLNRLRVLAEETVCWICGGQGTVDDPLSPDHLVSVAAGGSNRRDNLASAHLSCNKSRGARMRGAA